MASTSYKTHARAKPLEAMIFRLASRYEPALEGLTRAYVSRHMIAEREKRADKNITALVKAAMARLAATDGNKEYWSYTKKHSMEVGFFSYLMIKEARRHGLPEAEKANEDIVFIGGLLHDIGKTFLPRAIVMKELGVGVPFLSLLEGSRLKDIERRVLRYEHIVAGTTFERLFGGDPHIRIVFDMTGLHHVSYNGMDNGAASYPSLICGKDLPLHCRIAKTADFVSAVRPRHYRKDSFIQTIDDAVAYAVSVAGIELDRLTVSCLLAGLYDITLSDASEAIKKYVNPEGQAGVLNIYRARQYAKEEVMETPFFRQLAKSRALKRIRSYAEEAMDCAKKHGIENFVEIPKEILGKENAGEDCRAQGSEQSRFSPEQ